MESADWAVRSDVLPRRVLFGKRTSRPANNANPAIYRRPCPLSAHSTFDGQTFERLSSQSDIMSFVTRRALSTLIPPKIASPKAIGAAPDALRMQRVVSFYEKLPRGAAPEIKGKGLLGRYQAKYFGKNASATPIVHALLFLIGIGYAQNYYFHLRHHKNNAH
ncbi:hypothetical protein V8C40DRAFT_254304 [Trichoderma camerunense]|uniref:Mitochondrial F1F0 ATP synthase subunit F n=1 Tax=Trichoderma simmonsii TaxID=1491479 RepID=A0A8G0PKM9_9HYPO|nr:hypothetical protein H0G86_011035 [Trichoderma simmonsii]